MDSKRQTFCPRPWIHQMIRPDGGIKMCCLTNETPEFNAGEGNLKESFNGDLVRRVRKKMLNGEWDEACYPCKNLEDLGIETARMHDAEEWHDRFNYDTAVATTKEDGSVDYGPRYWDLRFGNFCNIRCRMCDPSASHSWYEEWADYRKEDGFHDDGKFIKLVRNDKGRLVTNHYDWPSKQNFWDQMKGTINTAEYIFMAGGEPFLIEEQEQMLKECIEQNRADKITLAYNTNLTTLPDRLVELWKKFKLVRVGTSIDGMGAVLNYQRYPSDWNSILKNLYKLDEICRENPNILGAITATVTTSNVYQFPEYIWWKVNESGFTNINNFEEFPVVMHHVAYQPATANIQIFPKDIKDKIRNHYNIYIEKFKGNSSAISILNNILTFMDAKDMSEHMHEFIRYTTYLDNSRGQDWATVVPELAELMQR